MKHTSWDEYLWRGMLVGIVLLALALRIWGIDFGLPFTYHVDEPTYVSAALNLGAGRIGRQLNPPVFPNLLFLEYVIYYVIGKMGGTIASAAEFEKLYRTNPSIFFLLGRLTTVFWGVCNVLIVYLIGKRVSNQITGIMAAFFLAIAFLHVRDSHFAVPDVMTTCLVGASLLFCLVAVKKSDRRILCVAAFLSGMAVASKWSAWPILVPLGYAYVLNQREAIMMYRPKRTFAVSAVLVFLCLIAGFILPAFQLLIKPGSYFKYAMTELRAGEAGGFGVWQIDTVPGYIFYLKTLWFGLGGVLLVFAILGLLRYIWRAFSSRDHARILLLLFPLIYYGVMGFTRHYFARYALPLVPFLGLFAGEAIIAIVNQAESKWKKSGWILLIVLGLAASLQPLLNSLRFDFLMSQLDTRTIAKKWIEENIPVGSKIAVDWPIHVPPLSPDKFDITVEGELGLSNHSIDYYRKEGFDYLVASSYIYEIPLVNKEANKKRESFYDSLNNETELLKEFSPDDDPGQTSYIFDEIYGPFVSLWQRSRPGPTLKIYRLRDSQFQYQLLGIVIVL